MMGEIQLAFEAKCSVLEALCPFLHTPNRRRNIQFEEEKLARKDGKEEKMRRMIL